MSGVNGKGNGHTKPDWRVALITTAKGVPKAILANAATAFNSAPEWHGLLRFDAFRQQTMLYGKPPWGQVLTPRPWEDVDDLHATNWVQHQGILVGSLTVGQAVEQVAQANTFHPVLDYLKICRWDGIGRLDAWLIDYLGAEDTPLTRAIGARWLISAIARVMRPGCKADCAMILEGPQGRGKSSALRVMFHPWFTDDIADLGTKDAAMQLPGAWCVEIAELDAMGRSEVSKTKAFMSRSADRYRPAYGRRVIEHQRQTIFGGTVNHNEYLRDETGARRFWSIETSRIDLDGLMAARDALWAEARDRFLADEIWWLDTVDLIAAATVQQDARRIVDPWLEQITEKLHNLNSTTATEMLFELGIPLKDQQQIHQNRAAACLKAAGWQRKSIRYRGKPAYRYIPTTGYTPTTFLSD